MALHRPLKFANTIQNQPRDKSIHPSHSPRTPLHTCHAYQTSTRISHRPASQIHILHTHKVQTRIHLTHPHTSQTCMDRRETSNMHRAPAEPSRTHRTVTLPSPSLSPNPAEAGGGGGGGGGGDRGRIPPVFPGEASPFPGPIPEPGGIPIPGFFLPDFRKSKKDAMKPAFSGSLSSAYKG